MHVYTVVQNEKITPSTLLLTLQNTNEHRPFGFQPGQYAAISFVHNDRPAPARCFSIVSPPTEQDILQFSTRIRGNYTKALSRLKPGDTVNVFGPFGGFVFDAHRDKKAVLIGGGIGITPLMSMVRYATRLHADNDLTLLYSCQNQDDIAFGDELLAMTKQNPHLKVTFAIGNGPIDHLPPEHAVSGYITSELIDTAVGDSYQDTKFFICGPPVFMNAMIANLQHKNVPHNMVMTEAFSQGDHPQTGLLRSWPANAYAIGAVGILLGSLVVMVSDLLRVLPPKTSQAPTAAAPFMITSARQKQLDQLVNAVPPSPAVISAPTTPTPTPQAASGSTAVPQQQPAPSFAPIYLAAPPAPRTTASAPPP